VTSNCRTFFQVFLCLHKSLHQTTCAATSHTILNSTSVCALIIISFNVDASHGLSLVTLLYRPGQFDIETVAGKRYRLNRLMIIAVNDW